jgi:hypothetical protein
MVLWGLVISPSLVRLERAPTRHQTQNPGLEMDSLHPSNHRHEKILGRAALRDTIPANKNHSEIPNSISPSSGPTQWLFQEPPTESKFLGSFGVGLK